MFLVWILVAMYAVGRHADYWPDALVISVLGGIAVTVLGALQRLPDPGPLLGYAASLVLGTLLAFVVFNVAFGAGRAFRRLKRHTK